MPGAVREAGRPSVLATITIHEVSFREMCDYVICIICACTYVLLDVADTCRNHHFHVDYMQVPLMWPMPAVTVTSSLPRLHDVADACRNRRFITIT